MESDRIVGLLEKYFEARTSDAEEEILRRYFASDNVAPELEQYVPMFAFFKEAGKERASGTLAEAPKRRYVAWVGIAAAVALAAGLYLGHSYQERKEAEYAYKETRKALMLLAGNLERGTQKVGYLNEFEQAKDKIYKKE